jgi:predicted nuclease of predicted toxin-antitoxin system
MVRRVRADRERQSMAIDNRATQDLIAAPSLKAPMHSYNTIFVGDVGLAGRDDTEVYAYAWRENRVLLTHDGDFLDDQKFPQHRNPGVVVLPDGMGDQQALAEGLAIALRAFATAPAELWSKTKSTIRASGEMTIRSRSFGSGKIETNRFRLTRRGIQIWEAD